MGIALGDLAVAVAQDLLHLVKVRPLLTKKEA